MEKADTPSAVSYLAIPVYMRWPWNHLDFRLALWLKKPSVFSNSGEQAPRVDRFKQLWRPKEKVQRIRLYATSFAIDCAWTGFTFAASWHAEKAYQAGFEILGYLGAAGACTYALLTLVAGRLSDTVQPEKIFRSALLAFLGCVGFLLLSDSLAGLFVAVGWAAAAAAFFWAPLQNRLSTYTADCGLGPALGTFNICWCCGVFAGPIISSWAYARFGISGSIGASGVMILSALLILLPVFPKSAPPPQPGPAPVRYDGSPKSMVFLSLARIAVFAGYFVITGITRLFPRFAGYFNIDVVTAGTLIAVIFAAQTLTFVILRHSSVWQYSFKTLVAFQLAACAGLLLLPFTRSLLLIGILFCGVGALSGLVYYSSLYYALALREKSGRRSGIHEALVGSGAALGPLLGGWTGALTGQPWSPFVFGAGLLMAAIAAEIVLWLKATELKTITSLPGR